MRESGRRGVLLQRAGSAGSWKKSWAAWHTCPRMFSVTFRSVYDETGMAYLGWRRIQDQQPEDWFPPETAFDARLLSDLGHFYSDYQQLIKSMTAIRERVKRIQATDPSREPERYQRLIEDLRASHQRESAPGQILANLMDPG